MSASSSYFYRAAHPNGTVERGSVTAENPDSVRASLTARGLFTLEVRAVATGMDRRPRMSSDELALGLRALATLLGAGLPLARTLAAMDDLTPARWGPVLVAVRAAVRDGHSVAAALDRAPIQFPSVTLGLIRAGEAGGSLAEAAMRAAQIAEGDAEMRRALHAELAYPLLLLVSGGASIALIVGFVLPRFASILAELGAELPATTRLVLGAGSAARDGWIPALICALGLGILWRIWTSAADGRQRWHALLLDAPVIGGVRRSTAFARFAAAVGGLLHNGVPIAAALETAARAAGDAELERRLVAARRDVVAGATLSGALASHDATTLISLRLIRSGEEAGRLPEMLTHAARIEADAARTRVRLAIRFLQPALVLGFGMVVAIVAAALLQAVYRVRPGA